MKYENRLLELRGRMTQAEFGQKLGLSQQNYGHYEKGKQALRSDLIKKICLTFGCSAEWLLGFDEPIPAGLTQQEHALISDFRACSTDDRLLILKTARNAAELRKSEVESAPPEGMEGDRRKVV